MAGAQHDIINQLKQDLLQWQGIRPAAVSSPHLSLGPLATAFPDGRLPAGIHEFISHALPQAAATGGFVAGLLSHLLQAGGACLWISTQRKIFPPGLTHFQLSPDRIIFIDLLYDKDVLWAMEEALKCEGLSAVIGEVKDLSFTASRRLQLAIEHSGTRGFLLRYQPQQSHPIASVTRWQITALPGALADGLPGVGFPRFRVQLEKIRNGRPGSWDVEWAAHRFRAVRKEMQAVAMVAKLKAG